MLLFFVDFICFNFTLCLISLFPFILIMLANPSLSSRIVIKIIFNVLVPLRSKTLSY